jgi:hypothetical protein
MQILTVVNDMLGTLGETPLNTLTDAHTYRGACLSTLDKVNKSVQADGWWFNRENLTITPNPLDFKLYLPGDAINVRCGAEPNLVQRGNVLYDAAAGTNLFDISKSVDVVLIRLIPFEQVPEIAAARIADDAILRFQRAYDGDASRTRELEATAAKSYRSLNAEETRQLRANLIDTNDKLAYIKSFTRNARASIRPR